MAANVTAYLALGSNLGNREENLEGAIQALQEHPHITVTHVSSFLETEPVGGPPGQGRYLNAAAEFQTDLTARQVLDVFLDVERRLGRVRHETDGPRTIDIDLLLFGNFACHESDLIVPHPRMHRRQFVLQPLAEIAPALVHPVLGRTVADLLLDLRNQEATESPDSGANTAPLPAEPGVARDLAGLRALVTGSTSGIGKAIALELAAAGADVIVHGRNEAAATQTEQAIRRSGVRTAVVLAELSSIQERVRLIDSAWDTWDGLDLCVNNAGADTLTSEAAAWSFERKLEELWKVDVEATIHLSRAMGGRMKARGSGVILNMGWDQADAGMAGDSGQLFGVIKGAVMAFTRSLALDLAPEVRVNCLAPGWIRTAWGEGASERWQERVRRETPLGRWGLPVDVAVAAHWLCSPEAKFITGQTIRINGGAVRN